MQRRFFHRGGGGAVSAAFLVVTALGLAAAPAVGQQAGSGSPAPDAQSPAGNPPAATPPGAPTSAPVPVPRYRSPLDDYRPYRVDEPLLPWREANDAVGGLGGHMGHLERPAHGGGQ